VIKITRVDIEPENKAGGSRVTDFPKLKLDKVGDRGRIVCVEQPVREFVHRLVMPKLVDGKAIMITKTRMDKTEYQTFDTDFVGNQICHGEKEPLLERGSDPTNCILCAAAVEDTDIPAPKRRYAMHVIRYATTKPSSTDISLPFQVSCVVWSFTDMVFNRLADIKKEWGPLPNYDLVLGPLESPEGMQKFVISPGAKAEWLADDQRKNHTMETFKNNQAPDLSAFCGRRSDVKWVQEDLDKIQARYRIAHGSPAVTQSPATDLKAGLDDLIDPAVAPSYPGYLGDNPFASPEPEKAATPKEPQPAAMGFDELEKLLGG
jgi:hypothetical protein